MNDTKEEYIKAGIDEINKHGLSDFSMRRISTVCGKSCAAPYRHFKNKDDFILEIFRDGRKKWCEIQEKILASFNTPREIITELCCAYVEYLLTRQEYALIIFSGTTDKLTDKQKAEISGMSEISRKVVGEYCDSVGMPEEIQRRKIFLVRALMYSTAIMINSGELKNKDRAISDFRTLVDREFDLP